MHIVPVCERIHYYKLQFTNFLNWCAYYTGAYYQRQEPA